VPGFYAADGNAAVRSADSGDKWRVHFSADEAGKWSYVIRFLKGTGVALADRPAGASGGFMDRMKGSFEIGPADGPGNGFYSKGRLQYVGERYQRFAGLPHVPQDRQIGISCEDSGQSRDQAKLAVQE